MGIRMAGIDYTNAGMEEREPFSLSTDRVNEVLADIHRQSGVRGCVLISTCNRTELYLSFEEDVELNPAQMLCEELDRSPSECALFTLREEHDAVTHLMMLAAGLRSQIRGEDQVITQVRNAAAVAREQKCMDGVLETLFRCAVSAGKKAKTEAPLSAMETSTAHKAVEVLAQEVGALRGKRALVIGNGQMGRLAADLLAEQGCSVLMTLRGYKHGTAVVPAGCDTVPYDKRYDLVPQCDLVISATTSPHFTLCAAELQGLPALPACFVDLAVPRDIDPEISAFDGVRCWNVDTLGGSTPGEETAEKLRAIEAIVSEYILRFDKWRAHREILLVAKEQA